MKQEEPQIHGKYWRHETGVADTSRKRQSTERAGETAGTEKKAGRSRKSPAAKKAEETLNEKKSRGEEESFVWKRHRERNRKPKPRQPGAGAGGEKWYRGIYGNGSGDYCIICNIGTFVFEQFRALRLCRKFSAIDSAWRIRRDGVSGAIPFIYGGLVFIFQTEATRKP